MDKGTDLVSFALNFVVSTHSSRASTHNDAVIQKYTIIFKISQLAIDFDIFEFSRDFRTYPVKKSKQMLLPIQPYFNVCQKKKIGFVML